ncbi:TIGR03086 family protein [Kribbella sandramycini]|uniref:TIGR03086 family protein n=1 Tax=Kribbella sandramycini TaxID=60450 RepID=A0A7Y4P0U2_9ACTN|nr:TIGR03086 family metal-binding protein [Kribbella sandramycini]MBB6566327.1 uncharacterized protein (TIGR03086 family) [Kribbella sandramycini]NOL43011.1 TIGR03086 family protein [Kribbella sandramycini]
MSTIDYVTLDRRAVQAGLGLVGSATDADLGKPTPCQGWTLHDLLAHMTAQHYGFAAASRGEGGLDVWQPRDLGADPIQAYVTAAEHVLDAFAADGVTERRFPLPEFGPDVVVPGGQAISFHFIDYVVHSWDVARSLGTTAHFTTDLLDAAWTVAQVVPTGEARLAPGAPFGPDVPYAGDDQLDRIVALLGRSPNWPN